MAKSNSKPKPTIKPDTEGTSKINQLAASLDNINNKLTQTAHSAKTTSQSFGQLGNQAGQSVHNINRLTQAIQAVNNELQGTVAPANRAGHALDKLSNQTSKSTDNAINKLGKLTHPIKQGFSELMSALNIDVGLQEIIQLSDEFNNLESRVRLATESGGDFNHAMASLRDIADHTTMPLTETGDLFTKLTQATKELGYSQQDVLGLTKTISEAMAVSGGDMANMEAGLTQLIQGLSTGALQGDKFNLVVERFPRLAQAMADGLGVTINELKTMAGEGKLTAETMGEALKSQADKIAYEYSQMPATVSGSLTVLKNSLMGFIGELDNELSGSNSLATFITEIANNIKNIDSSVIDGLKNSLESVGVVAKVLLDSISAIPSHLGDVLGAMMGLEAGAGQISLLQGLMNGLALTTGAVADGFKALQIVIYGTIADAQTDIARFATIIHKLTGFGGEFAKTMTENAKQAQAEFEKLVMGFESSLGKAMDDIGKTTEQKLQEVADTARQKYEQMAQDGTASTTALEVAFKDYAHKAIQANGGVVDEVLKQELAQRNLQAIIDETGKVAITAMTQTKEAVDGLSFDDLKSKFEGVADKLNLDFDKATVGISQGFGEFLQSVADLSAHYDDFTKHGVDGTQLLIQALTTMKDTANNERELIALADLWQDLGQKGQLSAEQLKAGLDGVNGKLDGIKDGINSVAEAYKTMGLSSQAELQAQADSFAQAYDIIAKSGTATTQTLEEAFRKYAQSAIRANNGVADATLQAQAAERGLAIQVNETGQASIVKKDELRQAVDNVTRSTNRLADSGTRVGLAMANGAEAAKEEYDGLAKAIDDANKAQEARKANNSKATTNPFGTKTGIEKFLKEAGLSEEQAMKGALQFEQEGKSFSQYKDGKHLSMRLLEYAESVRYSQRNKRNDGGGGGLSNGGISPQDIVNAFDERTRQQILDEGGQLFAQQLMQEAKRRAR